MEQLGVAGELRGHPGRGHVGELPFVEAGGCRTVHDGCVTAARGAATVARARTGARRGRRRRCRVAAPQPGSERVSLTTDRVARSAAGVLHPPIVD
ncbi:hypothetical protein ACH4E7_36585 [Kitasatospora sp. NPDC018058]|uniref:hypothetical protein n=1 Tax=Kitasatospora sp. NPDC018058 TaxID=3364025 RepID=UPI0037C0CB97